MSRLDKWMPLHISDYLADTQQLTAIEHGAYLLLLMEHWRRGPLPNDDIRLCNIARVDRRTWNASVGRTVKAYFTEGEDGLLHQKRAIEEREKAISLSEKRREAGSKRGSKEVPTVTEPGPKPYTSADKNVEGSPVAKFGDNSMIPMPEKELLQSSSSNLAGDLLGFVSRYNVQKERKKDKKESPLYFPPSVDAKPQQKAERAKKIQLPIPADWVPSDDDIAFARDRQQPYHQDAVLAFINWHHANGKTSADPRASWRTWVLKSKEFGRNVQPVSHGVNGNPEKPSWMKRGGL